MTAKKTINEITRTVRRSAYLDDICMLRYEASDDKKGPIRLIKRHLSVQSECEIFYCYMKTNAIPVKLQFCEPLYYANRCRCFALSQSILAAHSQKIPKRL